MKRVLVIMAQKVYIIKSIKDVVDAFNWWKRDAFTMSSALSRFHSTSPFSISCDGWPQLGNFIINV